ncbi:Ger(x)C family spore germination protein [Geosporobacter ferrireducens]|uniref:Uncharacterized protein n=1 Tax=Geosporobacter ferrireducens TaxID=1424294 RepID=A0A1D8GH55_9FIRM|nr:Ger(x)C family spore germination protein [Geosporobacter ferrireducens]AOT70231.1 hypothetical protein Gferi_11870 [Geosporobacter ferrireducens]MTI55812.1 Ger(x)C family spore germination protein [Geosporobacter ferrireducens]
MINKRKEKDKRTRAKRGIVLVMLTGCFLTGCWDHVEIQERGFVLGVAIDKASPLPMKQETDYRSERDIEKMPLQKGEPSYTYTIQVPIIVFAKNQPTGVAGGGAEADATWNMTIQGKSFMEANRQYSTRTNYPPFYEHLQAIIISEDVAREGITASIDLFLRDHEMRRRTRVFITPGEAKTVLDVQPRIEDYPAMYLAQLPFNASKTSRILHKTDLGEMSELLHAGADFVLPRVVATKDEIKDAGAAVFKGDKMVGWLGELDTIYLKWVRDAVLGGVIVVSMPNDPESVVTLEIKSAKTKVRPKVEGNGIKMDIRVKAEFSLAEKTEAHFRNALDEDFLKELETKAERDLRENMEDTVRYVQKEFGADIFLFNLAMERYAPDTWDQVKDKWADIFPQVEVAVSVKAKIAEIGTMK